MLSETEIMNRCDKELAEALAWQRGVNQIPEPDLKGFDAGFKDGWRKAIATLKARK